MKITRRLVVSLLVGFFALLTIPFVVSGDEPIGSTIVLTSAGSQVPGEGCLLRIGDSRSNDYLAIQFCFRWTAANVLALDGTGQGPDPIVNPPAWSNRWAWDDNTTYFGGAFGVSVANPKNFLVGPNGDAGYALLDTNGVPRAMIMLDTNRVVQISPGSHNDISIHSGAIYIKDCSLEYVAPYCDSIGFFGATPAPRQTIGGATLEERIAALEAALRAYGLGQ